MALAHWLPAPSKRSVRPQLLTLEDRAVPASLFGDFNGDGYDDLAVGMPNASDNGAFAAGAVLVSFGSADGLRTDNPQLLTQDNLGLDMSEANDAFGSALAAGDFNGDGEDDLAIGAPGEDSSAGAVYVLYGSAEGPAGGFAIRWDQNSPGIQGVMESDDKFGATLAAGDFDGNGRDDLAIAAPSEILGSSGLGHGVVHVLSGSLFGLLSFNNQLWSQDSAGIPSDPTYEDRFGSTLAVGDFNGDGKDDLAIGVPGDHLANGVVGGAVHTLHGSASGLSSAKNQYWSQDSTGIAGVAEAFDRFGDSLAAGDFNGDGKDDLAIGVPNETIGSTPWAGAVHVLYGTVNRLSPVHNQLWTEANTRSGGAATTQTYFGSTLAVGDFDGNGRDDLVIGSPGNFVTSGRVTLLTGVSSLGLTAFNQSWTMGPTQGGDTTISALAVGDYNGDGKADLAIGLPSLGVGGTVRVMFGGAGRLSPDRRVDLTMADFDLFVEGGFGTTL